MASTVVTPITIRTYEGILRQIAQQKSAFLRGWVMERRGPDMHLWDTIGTATVAQKTNGTQTATPENGPTFARRRSVPTTWHTGATIEPEDIERVLTDPTSPIAQAQGAALARKIDDLIISAALGASEDEAGTSTPYPAVAQTLGGATQAFDFTFITGIVEKFLTSEIYPDEEKVIVIRPNAAKKLLAMTQATSSDYVNAKALATTGYVDKWMGMTWVVSNLLPNVTGLQYYYLVMTRRAVGLHILKDIWTRVAEDPTISFAKRVYAAFSMGAVRVEDCHVIRLHVLES